MSDEQTALSRRAVACKGWRWMPGMLSHHGERQLWCSETEYEWSSPSFSEAGMDWRRARFAGSRELPDLTDPATLGCLLALVRETWGCAVITSPDYDEDDEGCQGPHVIGWRAVDTERWVIVGEGKTEAEALVVALEGAP
jgi:hypothetical protein